jgi:hypothetical protein
VSCFKWPNFRDWAFSKQKIVEFYPHMLTISATDSGPTKPVNTHRIGTGCDGGSLSEVAQRCHMRNEPAQWLFYDRHSSEMIV